MKIAHLKEKLVDACIIATVTLAMLLGSELAARAAKCVKNAVFPPPQAPSLILKQAWGRQYLEDDEGLSFRHVDYVEFREQPYRSRTITVDEHGRRHVPGNCESANAFTVWMFGGSTMFGYGAPDQFTIPAYLSEILNRAGRCTRILNFGAGSWQSSQELIQLIELLKRDQRPHAVIFYDGVNELTAMSEGAPPGGVDPGAKTVLRSAFDDPRRSIIEFVARRSVLVSVVSNRIPGIRGSPGRGTRPIGPAGLAARAQAMTAIYAQNVRLVDLLAKEYTFDAYFFLQPYPLISRKKLTTAESAAMGGGRPEELGKDRQLDETHYRAFGQEAALKGHPRYFDISAVFDGLNVELFADHAHLLPEGNRIVAERIAREIALPPVAK